MKNARRPEGQTSASGRADSTPARFTFHQACRAAVAVIGVTVAVAVLLAVLLLVAEVAR
ncbi:hypothetical protein [Pseudazoarcus pumilus]|uniref:hypothetical protein n=1 Tax=Pseudazoarcus pumilus TaxID=2067960 RepID=UPI0013DB7F06|nr:hypothetical protein [Pseudazoarcus pumilus]